MLPAIKGDKGFTIDPSAAYLVDLTLRLANGVARLPESQREQHRSFFQSKQRTDGGFAGREGESDLYYTAFALRALAVLAGFDEDVAQRTASFLRLQTERSVSVVDLISLVFATRLLEASTGVDVFASTNDAWPRSVAATLEQLRRPDGGYAKSLEGHASSTYQTFLIVLAYQMLELPLPNAQGIGKFVLSQQRDDGGFVEIRAMRRSGTNPTAAAIGTFRAIQTQVEDELLSPSVKSAVAQFLENAQTEEGGLRANTQIPMADLLSTFTGLQTLYDIGAWEQIDTDAALHYVQSLEQAEGGFHAAAWDDATDVEYSFYGIASLGLLQP